MFPFLAHPPLVYDRYLTSRSFRSWLGGIRSPAVIGGMTLPKMEEPCLRYSGTLWRISG